MEVKTVTHEKKNTKETIYYIPDNSSDSKIKAGRTELLFWHREDGPAYIAVNSGTGLITCQYEGYYINNKEITKDEWERDYSWKLSLKGTPMGEIFK